MACAASLLSSLLYTIVYRFPYLDLRQAGTQSEYSASTILKSGEHFVTVWMRHSYLMFTSLLAHAVVDELGHQVGGGLAGLEFSLHLLQLLLHAIELGQLHCIFSLPLLRGLLLGLDLCQSAAPLAADLQHVGGDAFGD